MKIATSLEQGKKLTEILPRETRESADMYWWSSNKRSYLEVMEGCDFVEEYGNVRAWSLTALLDIIPLSNLEKFLDSSTHTIKWNCTSYPENHSPVVITDYNDPIDACVDMIVTLHTLKLL